jgi:hypothetical protein
MYQTYQFVEVMHIYFHGRVYLLLHFPQFLLDGPEGVVIIYGEGRGAKKFFRPIKKNMSRVLNFMIANALLLNNIICMEVEIFKGHVKSVM